MLPRMRNLMIKPHRAGADASGRPPGQPGKPGKTPGNKMQIRRDFSPAQSMLL
jgi:hypothetical protein